MPARKSPAQITAQAAGDEASELGKQRSKSPGNQCTTTTVPIQSLNSTPAPPSLLLKPHKRCQLIDGRRYRDTARANTAGHQRNGSGNPWRSRPNDHPHPSRQRNSLHQSPKKSPAEARPTEAAKTLTKRRPPPAASRPTAARRRRPRARRAPASRRSARPRPGRRARRPRSKARSRPSGRPTPRRRRRRRPRRSRLLILNNLGKRRCRARLERRYLVGVVEHHH